MNPDPSPPLTGQEVVITCTVAAPRALVWQAWTDPTHRRQWWGPKGSGAQEGDVEVWVGGRFRLHVCGLDGGGSTHAMARSARLCPRSVWCSPARRTRPTPAVPACRPAAQ
jgi:hypothetical protein